MCSACVLAGGAWEIGNDSDTPPGAHADAAGGRVGEVFVQRYQAEAQPGAIDQASAVEFDVGAAAGARDFYVRWCGETL